MEYRHAIRVWDLAKRDDRAHNRHPRRGRDHGREADPENPEGRAVTAGMYTGLVYTVDTSTGTYTQSFDCEDIVPQSRPN